MMIMVMMMMMLMLMMMTIIITIDLMYIAKFNISGILTMHIVIQYIQHIVRKYV